MNIKNIIRWILVVPAALLAFGMVHFVNYWEVASLPGIIRDVIHSAVFVASGVAFVAGGALTAPFYHRIVSIVLASVLSTIMVIGLTVQFCHPEEYQIVDKVFNVSIIIGTIIGAITIYEEKAN